MPKIHWLGIIDEKEIEKYQKGKLNTKAVKMKMPKTMNEMMTKALPFLIPAFIIMFASMNIKTLLTNKMLLIDHLF